jgi:hypothetical protein
MWVFLLAAVGPLAKQVLFSLGIGIVTYAGLSLLETNLQTAIIDSYNGLPYAVSEVCGLAGINTAFGIILGAITARVGFASIKKLGFLSS